MIAYKPRKGFFDISDRLARQLAYHLCRLDCDDEEYLKARDAIKGFANGFHRVGECARVVGQAAEDTTKETGHL